MRYILLYICACLPIKPGATHAAVTEAWVQRYNAPANGGDRAQALAVDGSGHVVVTGHSQNSSGYSDFYTARYAATNGALLWERRYDAPANRDDRAQALALDGSGNVIVTGSSDNSSGNADYLTVKYAAATGAWLWERRYSGPAGGNHFATALALDGSGNVLVTGQSWNGNNDDFYTAKYAAADGALLWEQRFIGSANRDDLAKAVDVAVDGNVLVTGASHNGTSYDC